MVRHPQKTLTDDRTPTLIMANLAQQLSTTADRFRDDHSELHLAERLHALVFTAYDNLSAYLDEHKPKRRPHAHEH
jgi:hypothetical protein